MRRPLEGGCACGGTRYRLGASPLFVHCCHCHWCQRETGSAFAVNALIESDRVETTRGRVNIVDTPSESGKGQNIARCPECQVALWSHYAGYGPVLSFIRVGTLDQPSQLCPDIHIFTGSKQAWVVLPDDVPAVPAYYPIKEYWPKDSLARLRQVRSDRGSR